MLADEFIGAFKTYDVDRLENTKQLHELNFVDREIQSLARNLSFKVSKTSKISAPAPNLAPASAPTGTSGTKSSGIESKASVSSVPSSAKTTGSSEVENVSVLSDIVKDEEPLNTTSIRVATEALEEGDLDIEKAEDEDEIDLT